MRENILSQIQQVFRKTFSDESLCISENTSSKSVPAWTSLTNILLISEIEAEFGIRFKFDEVRKFQNVGDMISVIIEKTVC